MLDQIRTNISIYLNNFLFEILDEYTIDIMEKGIKRYLKELRIFEYDLRTTIFDKTNIKMDLNYDDSMITFFISRN